MKVEPLKELYDVAVIGMGPVGATLANLLAIRGLSVLIIDRERTIYNLPRAVQFDGECMRVFQTIGISDQLLPSLMVVPGMKFVDPDGNILIDWTRPTDLGPQGWHASYRFHQPALEESLRARLQTYEKVDIRLQHDAYSFEQRTDRVFIRLEDVSAGKLLSTNARYVVGCDGARSIVRRFIGTELDDLKSHERWLVLDVILNRERPDLGDYAIQYCDKASPATYIRGIGNRRRWELMLLPDEDAASMSRQEVIETLLAKWLEPGDAVLERSAVYTFHSVVANGWRNRRMLIAGDAAHQTPPFMGQGMCAGVRDASNLAWKLADVITGAASDGLLDTYEAERSPHVREFIEAAIRLGAVIRSIGPEVDSYSSGAPPQQFATPQPRLGPGVHDGSAASARISEQPILADGRRLDDLAGYRPILLVAPEIAPDARDAADGMSVIVAQPGAAADVLARLDAKALLLRPDRYIAGIAHDPTDLKALIETYRLRCSLTRVARSEEQRLEGLPAHQMERVERYDS